MIRYEVTVEVAAARADDFAAWMRADHIPKIAATGCFADIHFERAGPTRFRTSYVAATEADLERYLTEHTARLRAEFAARFGGDASASREVWRPADVRPNLP